MEGSQVQRIAARMATAAAPVGRQDFLIPRAGNQLLRSRAGGQRSCFEIWRTKLAPAISRRRLSTLCATTQSLMCALAMAVIAEADLRQRIRTGEPKVQKCNFAKRTHLSHVESVYCVFQGQLRQPCYGDIWRKIGGGNRQGHSQHRNLVHR